MRWKGGPGDLAILREKMVARLAEKGVADEAVLDVMRRVPRHVFVDEALATRAYDDQPLPIGAKQTISRPHTVAVMSELLGPGPDDRVLEVGTGSGYQAAVLSRLARSVDTVERIRLLARRARRALRELGIDNVRVHDGDGTIGLPERAPWARIMVTAGSPELPDALFEQLAEGGRMVVPVADGDGGERLQVVERVAGRRVVRRSVPCTFVPLIGAGGYAEPVVPADPWLG